MGLFPSLDELSDRSHTGGAQQFLEFGQVRVRTGGYGGDHQGTLARAAVRPLVAVASRRPSV